jgi:hypothetical protein
VTISPSLKNAPFHSFAIFWKITLIQTGSDSGYIFAVLESLVKGQGCSLFVEYLPSTCEVPSSIPSTAKMKETEEREERKKEKNSVKCCQMH